MDVVSLDRQHQARELEDEKFGTSFPNHVNFQQDLPREGVLCHSDSIHFLKLILSGELSK
jgi:hypothetical protein